MEFSKDPEPLKTASLSVSKMPKTTREVRAKWREVAQRFKDKLTSERDAYDDMDPLDAEGLRTIQFLEGLCDRVVVLADDLDSLEGNDGDENRPLELQGKAH
jgi:hypothetical protein